MSNPYRNEVEIELNGTKYTLRPSFEVLAAIEEQTKQTIFNFVASATAGFYKVSDAALVFEYAIKAAGNNVDSNKLKRDMAEGGLTEVTIGLSRFLTAALDPGLAAKKN